MGFYQSLKELYSLRSLCRGQTFDVLQCDIFVCWQFVHSCNGAPALIMAAGVHNPGAGRHVLEMTLMKKISYYHISSLQYIRVSAPSENRPSLVEVLAFNAASAFHKKVNDFSWMWWNVRFRGSGFSLSSYVRGGPYPEQDVMPAQARAPLFGQILSLPISITCKTSLTVSQHLLYFWKECGFQNFPSSFSYPWALSEISHVI